MKTQNSTAGLKAINIVCNKHLLNFNINIINTNNLNKDGN